MILQHCEKTPIDKDAEYNERKTNSNPSSESYKSNGSSTIADDRDCRTRGKCNMTTVHPSIIINCKKERSDIHNSLSWVNMEWCFTKIQILRAVVLIILAWTAIVQSATSGLLHVGYRVMKQCQKTKEFWMLLGFSVCWTRLPRYWGFVQWG